MLKGIILASILSLGIGSSAMTPQEIVQTATQQMIAQQVTTLGLNWKVGEENNYQIKVSFIQGTMSMKVREIASDGIWVDQLVDLGFAGKNTTNILYDANTGEVKRMIVNGKEETPPKSNVELIETKEDHIKVPAGEFDCIHARLRDKDKNEEINAWINPSAIPLSGMLKVIQPSQMGEVQILLKSYKKL